MKIKADYRYYYSENNEPEKVLIIGIVGYEFAFVDKFGRVGFANKYEIRITDEEYLEFINGDKNDESD